MSDLTISSESNDWVQGWWLDQIKTGHVIQLEYPVIPRLRRAKSEPIHHKLMTQFLSEREGFFEILSKFGEFKDNFEKIPYNAVAGAAAPAWNNPWIPALDGIALYAFVVSRNPKIYMEIGSGVSTTFVRQAICDYDLQTKIISIDPHPRSEIDLICDEVIRMPLEDLDIKEFNRLNDGDILFCDNSHRGFQNTDVTVFCTEVIPQISDKDILIGIHDIFLPYDYPEDWLTRHYNEQYYLIGYIVSSYLKVVLPAFYCVEDEELVEAVHNIANILNLRDKNHRPAILWLKK